MIDRLTFITGNQNKSDFLSRNLGFKVAHAKLELEEVQSLDLHEVVGKKALEAFRAVGGSVLVEDVSLTINAMGHLPGTLVKWFLQEVGNEGLVKMTNSFGNNRTAVGNVCYGMVDGMGLHFFEGHMNGRIAESVSEGPNGFGFDAIFINEGFDIPRSEMSEGDYVSTSYRTMALKGLREAIQAQTN